MKFVTDGNYRDPVMLTELHSQKTVSVPRRNGTRGNPADTAERRRLEHDLRQAVQQDAFTFHFQPRFSLRSGEITGAEALLRWPHRRRGLVSPSAFVPLAEQTGLINKIGGFALQRACAEAMLWPRGTVAVNVSPRQLADQHLIGQVAAALEATGLAPERLELELTESMLLHVDADMLLSLSALRDNGIGLALDDFGTGFASLGMLRRLPLTTMKLDRSLVRDLPDQPEDVAIARAAVQTGHALGLTVVAEGVELESQQDFLAAIGCDEAQGYLLARPMPAEQFRARLAA